MPDNTTTEQPEAEEVIREGRELCGGSQTADFELRIYELMGWVYGKCDHCGRVLKPTPAGGVLRDHQPRNKATASLDNTRDTIWTICVAPNS